MTVFKSEVHQDIWIEHNCHKCFEPHEAARRIQGADTMCPILKRGIKNRKTLPLSWERTRSKDMATSITCNAFQPQPDSTARKRAELQEDSLFDMDEHEAHLVPVPGWPDRPHKSKDAEHA